MYDPVAVQHTNHRNIGNLKQLVVVLSVLVLLECLFDIGCVLGLHRNLSFFRKDEIIKEISCLGHESTSERLKRIFSIQKDHCIAFFEELCRQMIPL